MLRARLRGRVLGRQNQIKFQPMDTPVELDCWLGRLVGSPIGLVVVLVDTVPFLLMMSSLGCGGDFGTCRLASERLNLEARVQVLKPLTTNLICD